MIATPTDHLLYALAWASFALGHSVLASRRVKAALGLGAWTRVVYNLVAVAHVVVVLAIGRWLLGGAAAFHRPGWLVGLQWTATGVGVAVFLWGLNGYDLGRFAGTAQLRAHWSRRPLADDEPLRLDGAHRWMRHPLYAGGLLVLWGGVADTLGAATALYASAYLLIGMKVEERRLVALYGDEYRAYQARVPALLPWRGRAL